MTEWVLSDDVTRCHELPLLSSSSDTPISRCGDSVVRCDIGHPAIRVYRLRPYLKRERELQDLHYRTKPVEPLALV